MATPPKKPLVLDSGGFKRATAPSKHRLILAVDGLEKTGKDHFSLTAPEPIALISLDLGTEGVVQKFQHKKEIWMAEHRVNISALKSAGTAQEVADYANEAWQNIMRDYYDALEQGAKTIIMDTATELWEILRLARFGKLTQVMPHHYGPVNSEYREVVRIAYDHDANVILLHKLKDEYTNDKRTGDVKRAGFGDTGFLVQTVLRTWRDNSVPAPDCFHVTVTDCRQDPALNNFDMVGEQATFSNLAQLIFPETKPEDWE